MEKALRGCKQKKQEVYYVYHRGSELVIGDAVMNMFVKFVPLQRVTRVDNAPSTLLLHNPSL